MLSSARLNQQKKKNAVQTSTKYHHISSWSPHLARFLTLLYIAMKTPYIMVIDKVVELYREAFRLGLWVSLFIRHLNGQKSFSLSRLDRPARTTSAAQPTAATPSSTVASSSPTPVQSRTVKRPSTTVEQQAVLANKR